MGGWDAPWHWVVLAVIVIALFGYKKLPDAARSLGRSLRVFKTEIKGMSQDDRIRKDAADGGHAENGASAAEERAAEHGLGVTPPALDPPRAQTVRNPASRPRPTPNGRAAQSGSVQSESAQSESVRPDVPGRVGQ